MNLIAVCVFGIESILAREIRDLGLETTRVSNGRVEFEGDFSTVAKMNLWLRTAERVYINAGKFNAYTFDELYDGTSDIPWEKFIVKNGKFNIRSSNINSKLFSQRDCQRIVKKAMATRLCTAFKLNELSENGAEYKIELFINNNEAEINIDTTGIGLHKRGYRTWNVEAPLKETIAAALLKISYWRPGRVLLDPFCGSGTFPIEAAMMSAGIAPGLKRSFAFEEWDKNHRSLMEKEKERALSSIKSTGEVLLYGSDISPQNVDIARKHAEAAGVSDMIEFSVKNAVKLSPPLDYGVLICNPPYGLRISEKDSVGELYKKMGEVFRKFDAWSKYVLTDSAVFEKLSGLRANKRRKVYNGTISCTFYQYFGPKPVGKRDI